MECFSTATVFLPRRPKAFILWPWDQTLPLHFSCWVWLFPGDKQPTELSNSGLLVEKENSRLLWCGPLQTYVTTLYNPDQHCTTSSEGRNDNRDMPSVSRGWDLVGRRLISPHQDSSSRFSRQSISMSLKWHRDFIGHRSRTNSPASGHRGCNDMPRASAGQCGVFPCPAGCADGLAAALCAHGTAHAGLGAVVRRARRNDRGRGLSC